MTPSLHSLLREGPDSRRKAIGLASVALAFLLVLPIWGILGPPEGVPTGGEFGTELDRVRRETRNLRLETELASGVGPYLLLDLQEKALTLKLQGVILREFPVLDASARIRHSAGRGGSRGLPVDSIWGGGNLLPEVRRKREVIYSDSVTPPDPSGAVATIPPTPEEAVPTPPTFRIRFLEGRSVAVTAAPTEMSGEQGHDGRPSAWSGVAHWVRRKPWHRDLFRLDITMAEAEAGALYRALSPGIPMLVVGPGPGSVTKPPPRAPGS